MVLGVAACGDGGGAAGLDASLAATCRDLQQHYRDLVLELDDSCTSAADCTLFGGVATCECEPSLGPSCQGHPVNRAALSGAIDTLRPIADTLRTRCDGVDGFEIPRICDCEPWATPTCEDNRCGYDVGRSCLGLCDPVAQTGCWAAEKCSWIWIVRETDVGIVACVADGTVPAGQVCTYGPEGEATGYDDCVAGTVCIDGLCETLCSISPDTCTPPATCVAQPGLFPNHPGVGVCAPPT